MLLMPFLSFLIPKRTFCSNLRLSLIFPPVKYTPTYLTMTWCALQHPTHVADDHHHSTHRTNTAVLHLLSCTKIQPTWRSVQCLLCCRAYDKATAALCSHPAGGPAAAQSTELLWMKFVRRAYITVTCPNVSIPRGPDVDVAIDRAAQLFRVREISRMGVTPATGYVILTDF